MARNDDSPVEVIEEAEDEYTVEAIRSKRISPKTKNWEYLIKWENYPESANTWEPIEHLNCPEIIQKFEEEFKNKKRVAKATKLTKNEPVKKLKTSHDDGAGTSRSSRKLTEPRSVFVENDDEDDEDIDDTDNVEGRLKEKTARLKLQDTQSENNRKKGFDRGLGLNCILSASLDENDKLWFVVKWDGQNGMEMVAYDEMVDNAPKELCKWYTDRLYWSINNPK